MVSLSGVRAYGSFETFDCELMIEKDLIRAAAHSGRLSRLPPRSGWKNETQKRKLSLAILNHFACLVGCFELLLLFVS